MNKEEMSDLMVYEIVMYKEGEKTGKQTFYTYEGDCGWICDGISESDCVPIKKEDE